MRHRLHGLLPALLCIAHAGWASEIVVDVLDASGRPVPDAVIYATSDSGKAPPAQHQPIYVEQKNKTFIPFVSVIPLGTRAYFPNHDGIGHHVYSFSPTKTFELPLSDKENSESVLFDKPGVVTVGCNIHDWMVAYIYVLETPFYSKTDAGGQARLGDLNPGEYTVHVWHPGITKDAAERVGVAAQDPASLRFSIELKPEYFWRPLRPETEETY